MQALTMLTTKMTTNENLRRVLRFNEEKEKKISAQNTPHFKNMSVFFDTVNVVCSQNPAMNHENSVVAVECICVCVLCCFDLSVFFPVRFVVVRFLSISALLKLSFEKNKTLDIQQLLSRSY